MPPTSANAYAPSVTRSTPGHRSELFGKALRQSIGGISVGESALTQTSTSATGAKMARADRIMSALVPVITTVVTTAMSTVITVAQTRRGERSIVAAASRPHRSEQSGRGGGGFDDRHGEREAERDLGAEQRGHRADGDGAGSPEDDQDRHGEHPDGAKPEAIRNHRGTRSAAETPTGANASIGDTLYTCRAAIADATTLVSTVVARAAGIA